MSANSDKITFVAQTVHKRDVFSETISGFIEERPEQKVVLRKLDGVGIWFRPIAWFLARKEVRGLRGVTGIAGAPSLLRVDREGLLRSWTDGTPLHLAKPSDPDWYRDAKRLLREMRRQGVTHNDAAKPQNWLETPDGKAAIIDFQLASVHRRRGTIFRVMAREDLRHLLKQKRAFAPDLLTPTEKRMLARKSLPSRVWMATGKRLYNFVTRRLMNWSDAEGTDARLATDGRRIADVLEGHDAIRGHGIYAYALSAKGVGLYVFAETDLDSDSLQSLLPEMPAVLAQPVKVLPRRADQTLRDDVLQLIATNRLDELAQLTARDAVLAERVLPIVGSRLNLTDRILRQ